MFEQFTCNWLERQKRLANADYFSKRQSLTGRRWADVRASRQMWEAVAGDGGDTVAGQTQQSDGRDTTERVRLQLVNVVVVQQDDGQVGHRGERVSTDDRQLVVAQIKHLRHVTRSLSTRLKFT